MARQGAKHAFGGGNTLTVALVAALAGLLIGANASIFGQGELGPGGLAGMVDDQVSEVARLEERAGELTVEVDQLSGADAVPVPGQRDTHLDVASGRSAVHGPGVTVTLGDAPASDGREGDLPPDSYVVHQEDVEAVLNTLWGAGAEAVAIQGQRLTSVSAVRCVGNVLLLGGRTYSPPYVIDAIGDRRRLAEALENSPLTEPYREFAAAIGLVWSVRSQAGLDIQAYPGGSITLRYIAMPLNGQEQGAL
ncbi:MAG: DUF881 domain-containing protein [Bifidobacteriaceae bacterium]|nr:DUF881 domain-containing protein [Bifidobacteriaceae bacterium]